MPISEERLSVVLTRPQRRHPRQYERNPVAGLIVESMAVSYREHEHAVREAGAFLLDLFRANDPDTPCLTLPVAMQVLQRDEARPVAQVCTHLAEAARRDVLLGIAVNALVSRSVDGDGAADGRRDAVLRTLYLLVRMFQAQEEADALDRHLQR